MAKTITDEKIKLSIIIDGNNAQKELLDLEKSTRKLNEENRSMLLQKKELERQGKKNSAQWQELTDAIKKNSAQITENKTKMSVLQNEIGITGLSIAQLRQKATVLRLTLNNMLPGSPDYQRYQKDLAAVNARLAELTGKAQQTKWSLSSIADGFNKYQGLAISVIASLTGVAISMQKMIDYNGKLSDAQADVMKTTGMTKKEVDELTRSFGLFESRTSRIDLLKIAEQGGRIGIMKEDIGDFVKVMDKATIALGDSFTGGAEEVADKLGKLKFLFKETQDLSVDKAYNAIGSAINDLGANGVATEANIAEFTTRIGSLTDVLKPTIQETLALGAAFEESGIEAEVSSRAYNIFMKQASTEADKFAKVMGTTKQSVEQMINSNPLEFMLKFAEGMRGMNATDTAKTLEYLGINADGANKVIGAMGNNVARFRELLDLSNNSFALANSLTTEANIKNETLGATLQKIGKKLSEWFSSDTLLKWLTASLNLFAKFIGAVDDADGKAAAWKQNLLFLAKIIGVVTTALISNTLWQKAVALWTNRNTEATLLYNVAARTRAIVDGIATVASQLFAAAMMLVKGNVVGATQALRIMSATMNTTPWGLIISLVSAAGMAYLAFSENTKKAVTAQKTFADQQKDLSREVSKQTADTKANITSLITLIQDQTISMSTRQKAYEDLVKISPYFNGFLKDEKFNIEGLLIVYNDYLKALDRVAYARQFNRLNEANIKKQINAELELFNAEKRLQELREKSKKEKSKGGFSFEYAEQGREGALIKQAIKDVEDAKVNLDLAKKIVEGTNDFKSSQINILNANIALREKQLKDLEDKYGADVAKKTSRYNQILLNLDADRKSLEAISGRTSTTPTKSPFNAQDPTKDGAAKKNPNATAEELARLRYENEAKYAKMILDNERTYEDARIAVMQDGYQKELAIENLRYEREKEDLRRQMVSEEEMLKISEEAAKARKEGDLAKYNALLEIKKGWAQKNANLENQINYISEEKQKIHKLKLATIEEKAATENIQKQKEAFERARILRETDFNNKMAALGNNEKAKAKLKKEFDKTELEEQRKFLEKMIDEYKTIINKADFHGIDLSLLTPEQVEDFKKKAEELGLTLSELMNKINQLKGKQNLEGMQSLGLNTSVDILGFTPDNWVTFFNNLKTGTFGINEMVFAVQALTNMWAMYSQYLTASENANLKRYEANTDRKKARLKRMLDQGFISQAQYTKGVENLDADLDKKKADIEYKQAKRQRQIAIAQTIMNTAQAIMSIWAQVPKPDGGILAGILTGMVSALGALQVATILKTPLPAKGYEKGLYPEYVRREQDGKVFKASSTQPMRTGLYNKPTILVGEGPGDMPELIVDKQSFAQLSNGTRAALLRELRTIKGFEGGYVSPTANRIEVPAEASTNNDALMTLIAQNTLVMQRNADVMERLLNEPIMAVVSSKDPRSIKELNEAIKNMQKTLDKAKK